MRIKIFGIYDTKAKVYGQPFFMLTTAAAIRTFTDLSNDKECTVNKHPSDYVLHGLGEWDDNLGVFTNYDKIENFGMGAEYINPVAPQIEQMEMFKGKRTPVEVK